MDEKDLALAPLPFTVTSRKENGQVIVTVSWPEITKEQVKAAMERMQEQDLMDLVGTVMGFVRERPNAFKSVIVTPEQPEASMMAAFPQRTETQDVQFMGSSDLLPDSADVCQVLVDNRRMVQWLGGTDKPQVYRAPSWVWRLVTAAEQRPK